MSVGVHALYTIAKMKQNANVVIFGAGPVGLLTAAAAKGLGAKTVIAVDINEARLKFAKEAGLVQYVFPSPVP
jgi:D-xylulose reductase